MSAVREWAGAHPAVSGLVVALIVCLALVAAFWGHLSALQARVGSQRETLTRMKELAREYKGLNDEIGAGGVRLRDPARFDISAVVQIADERIRDRIGKRESQSSKRDEGLVERTIGLSLIGVTRQELIKFLNAVEALDSAVRTKTLYLTPNKARTKFLDAKVTFSAYEEVSAKSK